MAFERFTKDARATVVAAIEEAGTTGRASVEAEHLLLALASTPELHELGLDHDELLSALEREQEVSLAMVGVRAGDLHAPATRRGSSNPKLATSAKLALQRALKAAAQSGERRIGPRHVLLGVLAAEQGRVPRAMELAGIDIGALRARL